jgi:hypothetical protein
VPCLWAFRPAEVTPSNSIQFWPGSHVVAPRHRLSMAVIACDDTAVLGQAVHCKTGNKTVLTAASLPLKVSGACSARMATSVQHMRACSTIAVLCFELLWGSSSAVVSSASVDSAALIVCMRCRSRVLWTCQSLAPRE